MASTMEPKSGGGLKALDTVLVVAAVVGGLFVALWVFQVVLGLVRLAFEVAVLVIVVAVAIRLVHWATRRS